ncbi:hypothetical protein [Enterocloster clostridioformis]|uniref:hypothetical protein n=1 Tax=Enterocloster clostridioformis TaxID=1531 RepID=UPI0012BB8982|nr:hypothetical protein [Enterocloster clostridioformis]
MNTTKDFYDKAYKGSFEGYAKEFSFLNGEVCLYPACNTLQVNDYSKFAMNGFNPEDKKKSREECFPIDLKNAYDLGAKLSK